MAPPESGKFRCRFCSKDFGRAEHLRRHELIHNENRPFQCHSCSKSFIRRDALQRHELTHESPPNLLRTGGRACSSCATAKARCSGELQCGRCRDKAIQCLYPDPTIAARGTSKTMDHEPPAIVNSAFFPAPLVEQNPPPPDPGGFDFAFLDGNLNLNWLDADFGEFPLPEVPLSGGHFLYSGPRDNHAGQVIQSGAGPLQPTNQSHRTTESPHSVFSSALTDTATPQSTSDGRPSEVGEYYVDGEPARLPRVKRRKTSTSKRATSPSELSNFSLSTSFSIEWQSPSFGIHPTTYGKLQALYQRLALDAPAPWRSFEPVAFPGKDFLEQLAGRYLNHFDQTLPFLHHSQRIEAGQSELFVLAMVAIGSHYLGENAPPTLSVSLHEFTRRCLLYTKEDLSSSRINSIFELAADLLHIVGNVYSGDERLRQVALDNRGQLQKLSKTSKIAAESQPNQFISWPSWFQRESHLRLAHCSWLVDCMLAYHFENPRRLGLQDASLPLPCHEQIWSGSDLQEADLSNGLNTQQPSLCEALQELYIDKKLPKERGEFSRVLLIHGLFHRMWDVEDYFSNPLSHWEPSAGRHSSAELLPTAPVWLPSYPAYAKWQNSACDCLDVLHWEANATIGQSRGIEHPTVLHLHFARIVLLTPYSEILSLARLMTSGSSLTNNDEFLAKKQLCQKWAIQHQYKARLAIIHAGVVFWHVRRYTIDAFYEGPAVALAALTLWAFGTFTSKKALSRATSLAPNGERRDDDSDQSEEATCEIILLDRPTDDELVQQFIRNGHTMQAHLTGVGDLYSPQGPQRALNQGCKLLSSLRCWGVSSSWLRLLRDLIGVLNRQNSQA